MAQFSSFDPFSSETILNGWKFRSCKFITYYCVILCKSSNLNFKLGYLFSVIFIPSPDVSGEDLGFIILIFLNGIPELSGILTTRTKPDHHNSREFLINIWKLFLDVWLAIQPQASGQAAANLSFSPRFCFVTFLSTSSFRDYKSLSKTFFMYLIHAKYACCSKLKQKYLSMCFKMTP